MTAIAQESENSYPGAAAESAADAERALAERLVTLLYRGFLRREPDRDGLDYHVEALLHGRPPASVAEELISSAEFGTLKLFVPPGHFYSPIVDPKLAHRHLAKLEALPVPDSVAGITIDRAEMIRLWHKLLPFFATMPFTASRTPPYRYAFENPHYSWGDGSVLHAMIRHYRPKRIIEVGSGWSSACALDTVEFNLDNDCELTFIEPYPKLLLSVIGTSASRVRIFGTPIQEASLAIFEELQANDILFIDSTHIMKTGSDVCFELFEILPRLSRGVLVHFHDILWPFEYKRNWAVGENRSWNEAYALRAFLMNNEAWRIVLFTDYLAKLERPMIEATYPQFLRETAGSIWLVRS